MKRSIFCSNEVCGCKLKEIGNHFKNNEKIPGNLLKNLEKSWKSHGILSVRKSGNPEYFSIMRTSRFPSMATKVLLVDGTVHGDCYITPIVIVSKLCKWFNL